MYNRTPNPVSLEANLKGIIIGNTEAGTKNLGQLVHEIPNVELCGVFRKPLAAMNFLHDHSCDFAILNDRYTGSGGRHVSMTYDRWPIIVVESIERQSTKLKWGPSLVEMLDVPIETEAFQKALVKASTFNENFHRFKNQPETFDWMYVKSNRHYVKLRFSDILFIEGLKDYVIIHTRERKVITALNLKSILNQLPADQFARTSKSYIVNTDAIAEIGVDCLRIESKEVPLGISYKKHFIENHVKPRLLCRG